MSIDLKRMVFEATIEAKQKAETAEAEFHQALTRFLLCPRTSDEPNTGALSKALAEVRVREGLYSELCEDEAKRNGWKNDEKKWKKTKRQVQEDIAKRGSIDFYLEKNPIYKEMQSDDEAKAFLNRMAHFWATEWRKWSGGTVSLAQ